MGFEWWKECTKKWATTVDRQCCTCALVLKRSTICLLRSFACLLFSSQNPCYCCPLVILRVSRSETLAAPLVLPIDSHCGNPGSCWSKKWFESHTNLANSWRHVCKAADAGDPVHVDKHVQMFWSIRCSIIARWLLPAARKHTFSLAKSPRFVLTKYHMLVSTHSARLALFLPVWFETLNLPLLPRQIVQTRSNFLLYHSNRRRLNLTKSKGSPGR